MTNSQEIGREFSLERFEAQAALTRLESEGGVQNHSGQRGGGIQRYERWLIMPRISKLAEDVERPDLVAAWTKWGLSKRGIAAVVLASTILIGIGGIVALFRSR